MEGTTTTTKDSNNGTFAKPTLISASVPRFSLSDEQREMEDVSPSEKHAIAIDLHGLHSVPWRHTRTAQGQQQQQQQTCAQSLPASEMEQFAQVLEQIPLEEKSDYEMAQVICPDICNTESSPVRFLQSEDHNPELAARKMVKYWKMRHHFFKAKAFMAMTLAGAMADDVNTLCEVPNFFRILGYDERGRTVFCGNLEGGLNLNHYDPIQIVRIIWYVAHLALQDEATLRNGVVGVAFCRNQSANHFHRQRNRMIILSFKDYLPLKTHAFHIVTCSPSLVVQFALPIVKFYLGHRFRRRMCQHAGTHQEILSSLDSYGIDCQEYFESIGVNDEQWILDQLHVEQSFLDMT